MMHEKKLGKLLAAKKSNKKMGLKSLTKVSASISAKDNTTSANYLENYWTVKEGEHIILLGETKYYQVREKIFENGSKMLVIEERDDPTHSDDSGVIKSDAVWGENPISKASGDRLGVYWEKKDKDGNKLPEGLIRLVGRYWTSETTYKVELTANYDGISEYAEIVVKKPSKLGNPANDGVKDVFGNNYALDDSIMTYAGSAGILPQYIKAMIRNETVGRFALSYRYEPLFDLQVVQAKDKRGNYKFKSVTPYWINSSTDLGTPSIPTDHTNLYNALGHINGYPGYQTVWDIYNADMQNSQSLYSLSIYRNTYGLEDKWSTFYNDTSGMPNGYTSAQQSDSANARFVRWMEDTWNGGMKNKIAQTRIAASYGLLQLVYYYGVSDGEYPIGSAHRPEDINLVPNSLYYGILHFANKLKNALSVPFDSNEWPDGLEKSYLNGLKLYNKKSDYAPDIVNYSEQYQPQQ